ncbi:uncharacterized protein LOC117648635 isoform X1 [Thrips palmi]|uniref:Uncharacterized protein LOC117648635 isoform X1 n=1 Tax=Thrips palmi TaxID=161013 RepID=A0A6P8Z9A0_THRPL|nr:uncharacterized protein LOC117648635 isoform X1 [Thrips palmi]
MIVMSKESEEHIFKVPNMPIRSTAARKRRRGYETTEAVKRAKLCGEKKDILLRTPCVVGTASPCNVRIGPDQRLHPVHLIVVEQLVEDSLSQLVLINQLSPHSYVNYIKIKPLSKTCLKNNDIVSVGYANWKVLKVENNQLMGISM